RRAPVFRSFRRKTRRPGRAHCNAERPVAGPFAAEAPGHAVVWCSKWRDLEVAQPEGPRGFGAEATPRGFWVSPRPRRRPPGPWRDDVGGQHESPTRPATPPAGPPPKKAPEAKGYAAKVVA
ncbi:unnamed protein product, partial [Amoebophrya sp. A120]